MAGTFSSPGGCVLIAMDARTCGRTITDLCADAIE